jgi:Zn-dependent protease with chaperone function
MPIWGRLAAALLPLMLLLPRGGPEARAEAPPAPAPAYEGGAPPVDEAKAVPVPEPTARAVQYHRSGTWLWFVRHFTGLAVPALVLWTGLSARLRVAARGVGRGWLLTIGVYWVLYCAVAFALELPLTFYLGYIRQHAYGLSNQTTARWAEQTLKGLAVEMVAGFLFLWIPYLLIARSPKRWWLYTALASLPLAFFGAFIVPIWIAPLFNHFGPLKNRAFEARIVDQAERAGIAGSRVFEVDMSADTKAMNAYVTGVLSTKRIVLFDTLLEQMNEREVLAVLGHEMGHYALGHVTRSMLLTPLVVVAGLWFVDRAGRWLVRRSTRRFGFDDLADVASLPLIILLMEVAFLVLGPLTLAYSRHQEAEADRFALELTRSNHSAATAFVKFQQENLGVPWHNLLERLWFDSHPSLGERIVFCNRYHPWRDGRPLVYGAYFRP